VTSFALASFLPFPLCRIAEWMPLFIHALFETEAFLISTEECDSTIGFNVGVKLTTLKPVPFVGFFSHDSCAALHNFLNCWVWLLLLFLLGLEVVLEFAVQ
jgi:hypothetical protein